MPIRTCNGGVYANWLDRRDDLQSAAHGTHRILVMRSRIAKVHQHAITQILGNMPLVARNDLVTGGLIGSHASMIVLGVELLREGRGPDQVNELDRQLAPLAFSA